MELTTPSQNDQYFFDCVGKALDVYSNKYDKFLLIGDFNAEVGEINLDTFLKDYDANNIVREKTCYKNIENPSCIDLFITNLCTAFKTLKPYPVVYLIFIR